MTMNNEKDQELRLKCAELASTSPGFINLEYARKIYDFVTGQTDTVTITKDDDSVSIRIATPQKKDF